MSTDTYPQSIAQVLGQFTPYQPTGHDHSKMQTRRHALKSLGEKWRRIAAQNPQLRKLFGSLQTDYNRLQEQQSIRLSIYDKKKKRPATAVKQNRISVVSDAGRPKMDKRRDSMYYAQFDVFLGPQF